ncbi:hypothetical protein [Actinomadura harenae]|uniref:Uncharacterized protein n=1 Tax=Actinomadura harenae TaxID=2483351 RepID=A0A3M2LWV5_9ACTN|nr:hypothetical protein [Actinomadura harenae]RMI41911.1 hypothetical protein EBO15_21615 [Actinomadura harenae]
MSTIIKNNRLFQEIRADGGQRALLIILEARGFQVTDAVRERVTACTNMETLELWAARAVQAETLGEVFGEG